MLEAGRRDRKIIIQRDTGATKDNLGKIIPSWTTLIECWAEVLPLSGVELLRMEREVSTKVNRFVILYRAEFVITEKDRISYNGEYWDIMSFKELGRREGLEITAQANR